MSSGFLCSKHAYRQDCATCVLCADQAVADEKCRCFLERAQKAELALRALRNEVRGTLRAHELAIRYDSGNSNWKCLEMALEMADAALATTQHDNSKGDK